MSKMGEEKTIETMYQYFKNQNRPYSVNDLVLNLKEHGKAAVQKALDLLVVQGKVTEKVYGKQKVYAINQNEFLSSGNPDVGMMDQRIGELTRILTAEEEALCKAESEHKSLSAGISTEDAITHLKQILAENSNLEKKLSELSQAKVKVSPTNFKKAQQIKEKSATELRKRKRMCVDILDAILEGYPKGKKALFEEVGIEAD